MPVGGLMGFVRRIPRWRWLLLVGGLVLPFLAFQLVATFYHPSILRFDPPQPRVVARAYDAALKAFQSGDLEQAEQRLTQLRQENPLNPMVHALLGEVYRKKGQTAEAIAATRLALSFDPTFKEAAYNLACDLAKDQPEEALASLRQAVNAGLDVRSILPTDPQLEGLKADPRVQIYLDGATSLPLSQRSALLRVTPAQVKVGDLLEVVIELVALPGSGANAATPAEGVETMPSPQPSTPAAEAGRTELPAAPITPPGSVVDLPPSISLSYLGAPELAALAPVHVTGTVTRYALPGGMAYRFTLRHSLQARAELLGSLGPWEVQIDGVSVPMEPVVVNIGPGEIPARTPDARPSLRPAGIFTWPRPGPQEPGTWLEDYAGSSAWSGNALAVVHCASQLESAPVPNFGPEEQPLGSYSEELLSISESDLKCQRTVYAFGEAPLPDARKLLRTRVKASSSRK
jgi:tetratricopeptide (TPR) repeat protein